MSTGKIPGPYVNDVKQDDGLMVYPPFPTMDIGARKSGQPPQAPTGPKSLDHVGGNAGKRGKEGK
jgi:hypothetical protein